MQELSQRVQNLNESFNVREATVHDITRIGDIWLEGIIAAFPEGFPEELSREAIDTQFAKLVQQQTRNFKFWLCTDKNGVILGWSTIQPFSTTPLESARNTYGFISTYMSAEVRGQGIGSVLLDFVIQYCKQHTDILYVLGIQAKENAASIAVGEKVGFRELGMFPALRGTVPTSMIVCPTGKDTVEPEVLKHSPQVQLL